MRFLRRWAPVLAFAWFVISRRRRQGWAAQTLGLSRRPVVPQPGLRGTFLRVARFVGLRELGYFSWPAVALRLGLRFLRRRAV